MKRPALVGIVNVTPDSFSGDGSFAAAAVRQVHQFVKDGADIVDLGAESTRPGAVAVTEEEEWERLAPVLAEVIAQPWRAGIRLSVDTRHAATAARALALGVDIINDVGGLSDPAMLERMAEHNGDIMVMHALTIPADPAQVLPPDADVVAEILRWKHTVMQRAAQYGIAQERLIYDPGIGFGKTSTQSLQLMLSAQMLLASGGRWLFGHSRKSFLKLFTDAQAAQRDDLTLAFSAQLAQAGADYLRVHAVARHAEMFDALCI